MEVYHIIYIYREILYIVFYLITCIQLMFTEENSTKLAMFWKAMADLLDFDGRKGDCNAKAGETYDFWAARFRSFFVGYTTRKSQMMV